MDSWPRELYEPGGGDARLYYVICGDIELDGPLYQPSYRSRGCPVGCELLWSEVEQFIDSTGEFLEDPEPLRSYTNCVVLDGVVSDPPNLDYFRDTIGLITYLVAHGGKAVLDLQGQSWWEGMEWFEEAFLPNALRPLTHVTLIEDEDWTYTRGMLKFGRPELSYRGPQTEEVLELLERLIEAQVEGAIFEENEEVGLPDSNDVFQVRHRGSLQDPDFRNFYLELIRPL